MLKKEQEGLREGEGEGRGGRVIGGDEEMEEVREGSAAGQNCSVRDKWTLTHDITPLALELLASKGVSIIIVDNETNNIITYIVSGCVQSYTCTCVVYTLYKKFGKHLG